VVPSPTPITMIEEKLVPILLQNNVIPIICGGGGIPVILKNNKLQGIAAVIDKDFAASNVANSLNVEKLLILTAVDYVYLNYQNEKLRKILTNLTVSEAENLIKEGHFAKGSMLPKIEAAINFVKNHSHREAIITSLTSFLDPTKGTRIVNG